MLKVKECSYVLLLFSLQVVKPSPGENSKQPAPENLEVVALILQTDKHRGSQITQKGLQ